MLVLVLVQLRGCWCWCWRWRSYDLLDTHAQLQPQRTEVLLARLPRLSAWRQAIGDRPVLVPLSTLLYGKKGY